MPEIPCAEVRDSSFGEFEAAAASFDKSRAVAHYTAMVRELHEPMRTQQQMRDELFEEWLDESNPDIENNAVDYAMEELASTPRVVADWLQEETVEAVDSLDEYRLARTDYLDWTAAQCLVMVMRGDQQAVRRASLRLRELFEAAHGSKAAERGAEILAEFRAAQREAA